MDGKTVSNTILPCSSFVGAGAVTRWLEVAEPAECIEFYPGEKLVEQVSAGRARKLDSLVFTGGVADPVIFAVASRAKAALEGTALLSDVEADELMVLLFHHVWHAYSRGQPPREPARGRLSRARLREIEAFVDQHLAGVIRLADLSERVSLSPYHFSRMFKATTSMTPAQFVTARRLERAMHLLLSSSSPVEQVCHKVGFRNVGFFRRKFFEHHGVLPGRVRPASRQHDWYWSKRRL